MPYVVNICSYVFIYLHIHIPACVPTYTVHCYQTGGFHSTFSQRNHCSHAFAMQDGKCFGNITVRCCEIEFMWQSEAVVKKKKKKEK